MWRGVAGSCWLGPGRPVSRADARENPVGKNGVMTHGPKVYFIIFAQNPRVLDRCLNEDLSLDQYRKENKCMDNLCESSEMSKSVTIQIGEKNQSLDLLGM
jgi:hypothetical protein